MAVRLIGQVLGVATGPEQAPFTQVTIQPSMAAPDQLSLLTGNATAIAALQALLGGNCNIYIAVSGAEITAIEAAVTVIPIDVSD